MSTSPIVVATDGSSHSETAVRWAAQEAALHDRQLRIVTVLRNFSVYYPGLAPISPDTTFELESKVMAADAEALARRSAAPIREVAVTSEVLHGEVVPHLISESEQAHLLVVGSHGRGVLGRLLLGSVSSALVCHAHCPVAVIRSSTDSSRGDDRPVVVGVDCSATSEAAIGVALQEADLRGVNVQALYAWSDVSDSLAFHLDWGATEAAENIALSEALAGWQEQFPDTRIERIIVRDNPAKHLIELSHTAQLVVVGSHGRGGFAGMLLGSTSRQVSHRAQCSVLVVRQG